MADFNPAIAFDSYKATHWLQFADDARYLYYYMEPRTKGKMIIPFGFQANIKEYFGRVPTLDEVEEAKEYWDRHISPNIFNYEGWKAIAKKGYYPVEIKAVPEGLPVPSQNVIATIVNTEEGFEWLPGCMETLLLHVWYPTTVATRSWEMKQIIAEWLSKTADNLDGLPFKLHDFGFRGVSSYQSAEFGGMAHLVSFMGTDTTAAIPAIWKYYDPNKDRKMYGYSIPAAEHSTVTSWDKEIDAYNNMLIRFAKPGTILAVVSDSYDLDNAVNNLWGDQLRQRIIESGAIVVIRPDSGDPEEVVIRTLKQLANKFGYQSNTKKYNVLNNVRVIQGDGISEPAIINKILKRCAEERFSADNLAFGMGGGLLQQVNRDTYGFAMKLSAKKVFRTQTGEWVPCYKNPKDAPWKASRKGRVTLFKGDKGFYTNEIGANGREVLRPIYRNGRLLVEDSFDAIRARCW